jgi:hypothetical protein
MNDDELTSYIESCMLEAEAKQESLMTNYRVGAHAKFWMNQEAGTLQFQNDAGEAKVEAVFTPIASFSTKTRTWLWSWANESLVPPLREKATRLKELAGVTGLEAMSQAQLSVDETMVNELTAMAVHHLGAQGYYRIPTGHLFLCLALEEVYYVPRPVA